MGKPRDYDSELKSLAEKTRHLKDRHLIELGGLVVKAGLIDFTHDDRATIYGAFLGVADRLRGEDRDAALALWQRRGKRAFNAERNHQSSASLARSPLTHAEHAVNCERATE